MDVIIHIVSILTTYNQGSQVRSGFSIKPLLVEPSGVPVIKYTHNHKPSWPSTGYYPWESYKVLQYLGGQKTAVFQTALICLIRFFTSKSTIFQLCRDGSSWVEPVLSKISLIKCKSAVISMCCKQSS